MVDNYNLLRTKEIIAILDGDTVLYELNNRQMGMPYLSGPTICEISGRFGFPQEYSAYSRWQYFDELLIYLIKEDRVSDLISFLTSKDRFADLLRGFSREEIEVHYKEVIEKTLDKINASLYFGGHELKIVSGKYIVSKIGTTVEVSAPTVTVINRDYIKNLSERAMKDIEENNLDSSITKARTILEETFCYAIEQKEEETSSSGDIGKLYKQVKDLYNMHADSTMDTRINKLLSGLEKIVSSIAEMRNGGSDAHGLGNRRISIDKHHARLFVNSSVVMAEFILSIVQR